MQMKHLRLFEEFNALSGRKFGEKLRIYAEASEVVTHVSPISNEKGNLIFSIDTKLPGDYENGNKFFKVIIPVDTVSQAIVETYEGGKKVFTATLEPYDENNIDDILVNFIEATNLYDDSSVQNIVDAYYSIKTPQDIKNIVKKLG